MPFVEMPFIRRHNEAMCSNAHKPPYPNFIAQTARYHDQAQTADTLNCGGLAMVHHNGTLVYRLEQ